MSDKVITVGMTLWMEKFNRICKTNEIKPVTVASVGRKYFQIEYSHKAKFDLKTLKYTNKDHPSFNVQLYFTREEIEQRHERNRLIGAFKQHFSTWNTWEGRAGNSLEELRQAAKILGIITI